MALNKRLQLGQMNVGDFHAVEAGSHIGVGLAHQFTCVDGYDRVVVVVIVIRRVGVGTCEECLAIAACKHIFVGRKHFGIAIQGFRRGHFTEVIGIVTG